jgi:hypothetical protein
LNAVKEYQDFEIEIRRSGEGYRAHVLHSPAGDGSTPFVPPVDRAAAGQLRASLRQVFRSTGRDLGPTGQVALSPAAQQAQQIGTELYKALFWGRVKELFDQSVAEPSRSPDRGLRIKLRFDLKDEDSWLGELPWELLRHPNQATPLAWSPKTPLVRYLEGGACWPSMPFELPLRILAVAANPIDTHPLDLEAERAILKRAAGDHSKVKVEFLEPPTIDELCKHLQRGRYHVLHFMGHGRTDPQGAALLFERGGRYAEPIVGIALAGILKDDSWLRLVVLNACHGGEHTSVTDPFSGVATTLVQEGLPAAVAMQARISDRGAIAFTESLYASLVDEDPIDVAVTQARKAISPNWQASLEWSVPVLFLRVADGRLFSVKPNPKPQPRVGKVRRRSEKNEAPDNYIETVYLEQGDFIIGKKTK